MAEIDAVAILQAGWEDEARSTSPPTFLRVDERVAGGDFRMGESVAIGTGRAPQRGRAIERELLAVFGFEPCGEFGFHVGVAAVPKPSATVPLIIGLGILLGLRRA